MKRALLIPSLAVMACNLSFGGYCPTRPAFHVITGDIACDNQFAIFTSNSEALGMTLTYTGVTSCWPTAASVSFTTNDRYLYIACWSDEAVGQGLLHDLHVDGLPVFSDDARWRVTFTGTDYDSCVGAPPASMSTTMAATIPAPPGGWYPPTLGCPNPGPGGLCYGIWGHVPSVDVGVQWSWYDSDEQTSVDSPFRPGFNHQEFLIFRLDMTDAAIGTAVCFGDGSGGVPCGCGNESALGSKSGCLNSTETVTLTGFGAKLSGSGTAGQDQSFAPLTFSCSGVRTLPGILYGANTAINGGNGVTFGDGIRCCGGGVIRVQILDPPPGPEPTTVTTTVTIPTAPPGSVRCYQYWYRDPGPSNPCLEQWNFNLSSALTVTWGA